MASSSLTPDPGLPADPARLHELRVRRDSPTVGSRDAFQDLKLRLQQAIAVDLDPSLDVSNSAQLRPYVHERLNRLLAEQALILNRAEKRQMLEAIVNGLSPS